MNIYELTANAAYLQALLEEGEIDEQVFNDSLESMMMDEKVESICKIIRNLDGQAAAFKEEEQRIAKKRQTAESGVKRLKDSLVNLMQATRSKKLTAGLFTTALRTSKSVEVLDVSLLPECYLKPQPPTVDRTGIGAALKAGEEVPGAQMKESAYVTIK